MPLDNKGVPFEYVSIAEVVHASDDIIVPLSRPFGFDRRLVYPMPHPYGAIGEARPTDRLDINTGARNAPTAPVPTRRRSDRRPLRVPTNPRKAPRVKENGMAASNAYVEHNTGVIVKFPPTQNALPTPILRPSSPRCSAHTTAIARPACQTCLFLHALDRTDQDLSASFAEEAQKIELEDLPPNHSQTAPCTGNGLPEFGAPNSQNANTDSVLPWLRGFLRPVVFKFPEMSAEADRLQRMAKLTEEAAQTKKNEAEEERRVVYLQTMREEARLEAEEKKKLKLKGGQISQQQRETPAGAEEMHGKKIEDETKVEESQKAGARGKAQRRQPQPRKQETPEMEAARKAEAGVISRRIREIEKRFWAAQPPEVAAEYY